MNLSSLRLFGTAVVIMALAFTARAEMAAFTAQPTGNKMQIDGTSTIHDWTAEGAIISGALELDSKFVADPTKAQPGKVPAKVEATIPVRTLKGSKGQKMDTVMYQALKLPQFPRIEYRLIELTLKETPKSAEGPYSFDSKGNLAVAGVTNTVSFPVTITRSGKTLKASGTTTLKMTQFKVQPPVLLGVLSTGDDVKLTFDWNTVEKEAK